MLEQESKTIPDLTSEVGETLRLEAFNALKSLPRRGAEIGGFLIAQSDYDSAPLADAVEFVPSEHLYGPSYRPSPADLELIEQRAQLIRAQPDRKLLAYFRSCTREDVVVQPEDAAVLREVLPEANFIVLVKPFQNGNCTVRIFSADSQELLSEFDLQMSLAAFAEPEPEPEPESGHAHVVPAAQQLLQETVAPTEALRQPWLRYSAYAAAFILMVGAASYLIRHSISRSPTQPVAARSSDLGLRVENTANNFRVTWNRDQAALKNAGATLTIDDGRNPRVLRLDPPQFASGSLFYVTDAADLTFRLQVRGETGRESMETARVVVAKGATTPEPPKPTVASTAPEATSSPLITPLVRSWPAMALRPGVYRPAVPLHRITPTAHPSSLTKAVAVQVSIKIDTRGRVVEAYETTSPPAPSSVSAPAIDASHQWVFEPAKKYGRNVASDYRIVYWFKPTK
jgi:hypothetical protein